MNRVAAQDFISNQGFLDLFREGLPENWQQLFVSLLAPTQVPQQPVLMIPIPVKIEPTTPSNTIVVPAEENNQENHLLPDDRDEVVSRRSRKKKAGPPGSH